MIKEELQQSIIAFLKERHGMHIVKINSAIVACKENKDHFYIKVEDA